MKKNVDIISSKDISHTEKVRKRKKTAKNVSSVVSKRKESDDYDLIESFGEDDWKEDISVYQDIYASMRDW